MLNYIEIISIILIHWFADFVLQTDKQAKGKSKNWHDLLCHTSNYTLIWIFVGILCTNPVYRILGTENWWKYMWVFPIITFVCHTITDYFTSRLNSRLWEQGKVHDFFVSVGFDQVLHYAQLFGTYLLLKQ